jgi:hypothetical protein
LVNCPKVVVDKPRIAKSITFFMFVFYAVI